MPELPEAEAARRLAHRTLVGTRIEEVRAADDRIVFCGVSPRAFASRLRGRRVIATRRRGKYIWFVLDKRPWPSMHFGMGGHFFVYQKPSDRPPYWKMELLTDRGDYFAMTNPRRLGRIRLQDDPEHEPPISLLGFDPLLDLPALRTFRERLARRRAPIKAVLLDQSFAAGVGNWIADEVLYQARIDPRRLAADLTPDEARRVRDALRKIVRRAVAVDADKDSFPREWLFHHRWGRKAQAVTARGEKIVHTVIGGRTTAWVPAVQK
jgi:formamidopyrimidine-DNA glycosylase